MFGSISQTLKEWVGWETEKKIEGKKRKGGKVRTRPFDSSIPQSGKHFTAPSSEELKELKAQCT